MARQATGHVRCFNGIATARIRITKDAREGFAMPSCKTEAEAAERAQLLAEVAKRMRRADVLPEKARTLLENIAGASPRSLRNALAVAGELIGGELRPQGVPRMPSFGELGEQWTKGELAQRYPDQIRVKRSADDDESRLTNYVYPVLKDVPIDQVTLDLCEDVMRRLPSSLAPATRRNVGQLITRILTMAVYPLRLIERSPIPRGFLPAAGKPKALAYLYTREESRLLGCTAVPLPYRLLWGFLTREGMREGEALALTWGDLNLELGAVRLDRNKTDDPRTWALNPSVAGALRVFKQRFRPDAAKTERVFLDPQGRPIVGSGALGLPAMLRSHLVRIGLQRERPELFTTTAERRRIRVHDLRGTFVTVSLANGRSESWISDRTGHRSSLMIAKYKRIARTFGELELGDLVPLAQAIPELRDAPPMTASTLTTANEVAELRGPEVEVIGPRLGREHRKYVKGVASPAGFEPASPT